MRIIIRRISYQDVAAVSRIEAATFSMPWSGDAFARLVDAQGALYLVAEVDGQVLGCCGMTTITGEGNINNVVVAKEYRNKGIASLMLREMIRLGREIGIAEYTLEVRVGNEAAIHIYQKLGFLSAGIRPNFYEKPREDAIIMWLR